MKVASKSFVDTNVLIYAFSTDSRYQEKAIKILENHPFLSTQVLTESANVCLKKLNFSPEKVVEFISQLEQNTEVVTITPFIITKALHLHKAYRYSFYDSLILSAALLSGCEILFSEDMQHEQIIEGLTIINPFFDFKSV